MDKLGQGEKILRKQLVDCLELFQNIPFYFQKQESFIREQLALCEQVTGMLAQRAAPKLICAAYAECKIFINEAQKLQEDYCRTALLLQEVYQSALGTATEQFEELQQLFSQFARISFHLNEDYDKVHEYLWFR